MDPSFPYVDTSSIKPPVDQETKKDSVQETPKNTTGTSNNGVYQPPSLDQELASVMKGIGSFWGKVRKQSATVISSAEKQLDHGYKELTPLVSKAKANLEVLSEKSRAEIQRLSEPTPGMHNSGVYIGSDGLPVILDDLEQNVNAGTSPGITGSSASTEKGKGREIDSSDTKSTANATASASAFFTSIQSQISSNPEINKVSKNFTKSLNAFSTSVNSNIANIQAQIGQIDKEAYIHKGEHWLSEVQRMAKDAVKVVPPLSGGLSGNTTKSSIQDQERQMSRLEGLIVLLKSNDEGVLEAIPGKLSTDSPETGAAYEEFIKKIDFSSEATTARIQTELNDPVLDATFKKLSPRVSNEDFWNRYFFRMEEIEINERKRKQVLQDLQNTAEDDDFKWDDEDEDEPQAKTFAHPSDAKVEDSPERIGEPSPPTPTPTLIPSPSTPKPTNSKTEDSTFSSLPSQPAEESPRSITDSKPSPRASSDGASSSYDIVGVTSGNPSEGEQPTLAAKSVANKKVESDSDSDWE